MEDFKYTKDTIKTVVEDNLLNSSEYEDLVETQTELDNIIDNLMVKYNISREDIGELRNVIRKLGYYTSIISVSMFLKNMATLMEMEED